MARSRSRSRSRSRRRKIKIARKGYYRRPYRRRSGVYVKGSRVKPSRFHDKPWITREGKLGGPGYLERPAAERHKILDRCVQHYGYRSCLGSIMVLNRNTEIKARHGPELTSDRRYLVRNYGGPGSFGSRE